MYGQEIVEKKNEILGPEGCVNIVTLYISKQILLLPGGLRYAAYRMGRAGGVVLRAYPQGAENNSIAYLEPPSILTRCAI